mmetsp:Transcript_18339/g.16216  ORF Transcript_18339/g.16216 Transcript_18339/m.16216 type:complete len:158 (-) Transcript_18339:93-566(-)
MALMSLDISLCKNIYIIYILHWIPYKIICLIFFYFLLPNFFVLLAGIEFILIWMTGNGFNGNRFSCVRKMRFINLTLSLLFPIVYVYCWYRIIYSNRLYFLAKVMLYEIGIVVAGALVVVLVVVVVFLLSWVCKNGWQGICGIIEKLRNGIRKLKSD